MKKVLGLGLFCLMNVAMAKDQFCFPEVGRHMLKVTNGENTTYDFLQVENCNQDFRTNDREIIGRYQNEYQPSVPFKGATRVYLWSGAGEAHLTSAALREGKQVEIKIDLRSDHYVLRKNRSGTIYYADGTLMGIVESMEFQGICHSRWMI